MKASHKYTRGKYHKYKYYEKELEEVRQQLINAQYGDCAYIAYERKIPQTTVRTWKKKVQKDPNYSITKGYKRKRRTIFTIEEEEALSEFIRVNTIACGQLFTDQDFRILAFAAFWDKYLNSVYKNPAVRELFVKYDYI